MTRAPHPNVMERLTVGEAMRPVPQPFTEATPLDEMIARFADEDVEAVPVIDAQGRYRGTVIAQDVERGARDEADGDTAGALARDIPTLTADQSLHAAIGVLVRDDVSGVPVLASRDRTVIGWLTHRDLLRLYHEHLPSSGGAGRGDGMPPRWP